MFGLPPQTEFNKRVPKQKFYDNSDVPASLRRVFAEQIKAIYWCNKLAPSTLRVAQGERVTEVEVFELRLNAPSLDETVLRQIDKAIPYHLLFVLTCGGRAQAWVGYKEASAASGNAVKVKKYYHTEWMSDSDLRFVIDGLDIDAVYENLVRQIAGERLQSDNNESLQDSVKRDEEHRRLEKQIAALESKLRKEKQLNRRMEINVEIKKLRKKLEEES